MRDGELFSIILPKNTVYKIKFLVLSTQSNGFSLRWSLILIEISKYSEEVKNLWKKKYIEKLQQRFCD